MAKTTRKGRVHELKKTKKLQKEIGAIVRELRKAQNLTQTQLADKMDGRDKQVVQRLEQGGTNISLNLLRVVSEALDVDIVELFPKK